MSAIRALADQLASRSDDDLRRLLTVRPDLVLPPVPDFSALAARASTRASLQRALDALARPHLQVLEALVVLSEDHETAPTRDLLASAFAAPAGEALLQVVDEVLDRALIVDDGAGGLLPVGALSDALGPYPAGLGRPFRALARSIPRFGAALVDAVVVLLPGAASPALTPPAAARLLEDVTADAAGWSELLAGAPDGVVPLLTRLRDSPVGSTSTGGDGAASPAVRWLLDRCLLAPLDALHVELPRGVGLAVRGHAVFGQLENTPPRADGGTTRQSLRDNAAYGSIAETLRMMTALLGSAAGQPISTLRSGGVGVRELRRVREVLRCSDVDAAWLLELAAAAGLLTLDPDDSRWKATRLGVWEALERDAQWLVLVEGWLVLDRAPALVGSRMPDGSAINALAAEASRPDAPLVRRRLIAVALQLSSPDDAGDRTSLAPVGSVTVGSAPACAAPAGSVPVLTEQSLIDVAGWHQPRLHRRFARLVPGMLREAASLGLTGGGALTEPGHLVGEGHLEDAAARVREALPEPVSRVVLQADLTAVAPGYLTPDVARGLARMATPEGQGPATTYRFSASSIRSALDAGDDAASILAFLGTHSATEIPQALTYLVEDTAARYGSVRVGRAGSYLRTEDDAVVAAVLADPRAELLGVVQIAPTVLVAPASPQELTSLLKDLGFAAATDPTTGVTAPVPPAAPEAGRVTTDRLRSRLNPWSVAEEEIDAQLVTLRSARTGFVDAAAAADSETLLGLETLRAAIRTRSRIRLGTADSDGNQVRQVLVPLSVSGGRLRVFDPDHQVEKVVSVHRVMDVEILEGSAADG